MEIKFHPKFEKSCKRLFSNNPYYLIPRLIRNAKFEIKMAWQRVFRGYDDAFVWDLHHNFSWLMCEALPKLRKNKTGCPGELYDDSNKDDECHKWSKILLEIENGFKAGKRIGDGDNWGKVGNPDLSLKKDEEDRKIFENGMDLLKKYYFSLWD